MGQFREPNPNLNPGLSAAVPANSDLAALEVSPGVLLRITTATGDKLFSQAATNLDPVGTAGHLVSMAVADGVVNVSTALLANHMESALAAGVANAGRGPALLRFLLPVALPPLSFHKPVFKLSEGSDTRGLFMNCSHYFPDICFHTTYQTCSRPILFSYL